MDSRHTMTQDIPASPPGSPCHPPAARDREHRGKPDPAPAHAHAHSGKGHNQTGASHGAQDEPLRS